MYLQTNANIHKTEDNQFFTVFLRLIQFYGCHQLTLSEIKICKNFGLDKLGNLN